MAYFIGLIVGIVGVLLITPILYFSTGFIIGLVIKFIFGGLLVNGLNMWFGAERFVVGDIPLLCATLFFFASFIRAGAYFPYSGDGSRSQKKNENYNKERGYIDED